MRACKFGLPIAMVMAIASSSGVASAQSREDCANAAEDAQTKRQHEQLIEARKQLLICSQSSCPSFIRSDCSRWLDEVDGAMPSIAVKVTDAQGGVVVNAKIVIDGKVVAERADGRSLPINPGPHTLRVIPAGGGPPVDVAVIVAAHENVVQAVKLPPAPVAAPIPLPPPPPPAEPRGIPTGSFIAGGVAIAALGAFTVLEIIAQNDVSDLRDGCGETKSCSHDDITAAHTKLDIAAALLGVGVVAAATGVVLYFMNPSDSKAAYLPFRNGKFYF